MQTVLAIKRSLHSTVYLIYKQSLSPHIEISAFEGGGRGQGGTDCFGKFAWNKCIEIILLSGELLTCVF
jgi:hypothetical protein